MALKKIWIALFCAALCACAEMKTRTKGPAPVDPPQDPMVSNPPF